MRVKEDYDYSMNVGVDMHVLNGIYQGSRTYMLEIFSRVIPKCPNIKFYVFCSDEKSLLSLSPSFSHHNVVLVAGISKNPFFRLLLQLPYFQIKYRLSYFHVQYILPVFMFCKGVVSLHDILFESHPQYFSKSFVFRSKILMRWSALRAQKIFTISSFSKKEICSRYKVEPDKIDLVYCGVSTTKYFSGNDGLHYIEKRGIASKGYILSVGRLDPRKNLINMIQAYSLTSMKYPIVLVGQEGLGVSELYKLIDDLGINNKVFFIKDAEDSELSALYRHANFFIFPSFAEGFGLPVLEAMASGIPVITSNTTSLPEVAGDAGILINPNNVEDISRSIDNILDSEQVTSTLVKKGFMQVEKFSWEVSSLKVSEFYKDMIHKLKNK
jgi:glycosyltransferase involved in cell wall biosynthesis